MKEMIISWNIWNVILKEKYDIWYDIIMLYEKNEKVTFSWENIDMRVPMKHLLLEKYEMCIQS